MSSVVSSTTLPISVKEINNFSPHCQSNLASNQINSLIKSTIDLNIPNLSFIQYLSEIPYLDQQMSPNSIPVPNAKPLTEFKPSRDPQVSAGERMRVKDKGTKLGNHNNSSSGPQVKRSKWTKDNSSSGSHARAKRQEFEPTTKKECYCAKGKSQDDD